MAAPEDPRAPAPGTIVGGKYTLERFLAQGGMGAVYEASAPSGERVAVKVLLDMSRAAQESGALARFLREAELCSQLPGAHVVRVLDGGVDDRSGLAYLAMQLLSGEDLDTLIARVGPLHPQAAVRVALQAARGLEAAHRAGVVHRDIKPSNLFLDVRAGEVTVKVCDFGIAKVHPSRDEQHLTSTGHVLGSPMFMSPEQVLSSKRVDARTDVFSLAMTLYCSLTGSPPLSSVRDFPELVAALTTRPIPSLAQAAPWLEPGLCALVDGALLRDLDARCPDMASFAEALSAHAGGGDELTVGMLVGAPAELRSRPAKARPGGPPRSWAEALSMAKGPDPLLGRTLAGRYELVRQLGEGGMGAVYEAKAPGGQQVAVKVLRPDLIGASPDAMRRFVREARMAMSIQSDHVVRMTEVDTDMALGVPFITMELLSGTDLADLVREAGPLEPSAVCRVFVDACRGLTAAHALGVVHRDIKPANIFLHRPGGGDDIVVKICDFGIAKQTATDGFDQTSTDLTRTGGMLGSPLYMSPEQARNAKGVDARTDVWSICMSLYEALAGQKAWRGFGSAGELVLAICTQDVTPLQDLAPWVPPDLAEAVHRGLRRDARERFSSVDELAGAIAPHAARCPRLTEPALRALSPEQRAVVAQRLSIVGAQSSRSEDRTSDVATSDVTPGERRPGGPRRAPGRARLMVMGAVVAVLGFGGGLWAIKGGLARSGEATAQVLVSPVVDRTVEPAPTASSVVPAVVGKLIVRPPGARVTVDGKAREAPGGELTLSGEPGERLLVVVEHGGQRLEEYVTLSRDGSPSPSVLDLARAPRADASPPPGSKVAPRASAKGPASGEKPPVVPAGNTATAAPAVTQAKEWH